MSNKELRDFVLFFLWIFGYAVALSASLKHGLICLLSGNIAEGIISIYGSVTLMVFLYFIYKVSRESEGP